MTVVSLVYKWLNRLVDHIGLYFKIIPNVGFYKKQTFFRHVRMFPCHFFSSSRYQLPVLVSPRLHRHILLGQLIGFKLLDRLVLSVISY